jgi:hypothetical protein
MKITNRYAIAVLLALSFSPIAFSSTCPPNERKLHVFLPTECLMILII